MATQADVQDRIVKCQKLLETDPNSQIFAALAEAYRKHGELDKAFRVCHNGLKVHPSYGAAHVVMAKINLDRGLYDWAEIEAQKAIEIDGHTRAIELLLAEIYIYKGEFNSAITLLKRLHEADKGNPQITKLLDIARKLPEESGRIAIGASARSSERSEGPTHATMATVLTAREVLELGVEIPGMGGALFFNAEGLVVESEWRSNLDSISCAATLAEVCNTVSRELVRVKYGDVDTILIEAQAYTFYMLRAPRGFFLFAALLEANLGTMRMKIEELRIRFK